MASSRAARRLTDWVRQYPIRSEEFGLARHRAIFDAFQGPKREYRSVESYLEGVA
jgi:hypothetical protein